MSYSHVFIIAIATIIYIRSNVVLCGRSNRRPEGVLSRIESIEKMMDKLVKTQQQIAQKIATNEVEKQINDLKNQNMELKSRLDGIDNDVASVALLSGWSLLTVQ